MVGFEFVDVVDEIDQVLYHSKLAVVREFNLLHRTTFLINELGTIAAIIDKPKTTAHAEEILELF